MWMRRKLLRGQKISNPATNELVTVLDVTSEWVKFINAGGKIEQVTKSALDIPQINTSDYERLP